MKQLIKAEYLKQKKTLTTKIPFIAPLIVLAMSYMLTGGMYKAFAPGAWNWWYTLFLPGTLAIICNQIVSKDKKRKYHNIFTLSIAPEKIWIAKMIVCASYLFLANVIVCIGAISGGFLFGTYITVSANIVAAFVLTITYLWEIPLFMLLSAKFGMFASVSSSVVLAVIGTVLAPCKIWYVIFPSIPARAMCPILTVLPNGLPAEEGSRLITETNLFPAVGITVGLFLLLTFVSAKFFQNREVK